MKKLHHSSAESGALYKYTNSGSVVSVSERSDLGAILLITIYNI